MAREMEGGTTITGPNDAPDVGVMGHYHHHGATPVTPIDGKSGLRRNVVCFV